MDCFLMSGNQGMSNIKTVKEKWKLKKLQRRLLKIRESKEGLKENY